MIGAAEVFLRALAFAATAKRRVAWRLETFLQPDLLRVEDGFLEPAGRLLRFCLAPLSIMLPTGNLDDWGLKRIHDSRFSVTSQSFYFLSLTDSGAAGGATTLQPSHPVQEHQLTRRTGDGEMHASRRSSHDPSTRSIAGVISV